MQAEIIHKERRINELERKLRQREDECERVKQERDRLVAISNELRGELNIAQRRLLENAEESLGHPDETVMRMNERLEEQQNQIDGMDRYIDELDVEIR
jgi:chromosome segregation ATPase